MKTSEAEIGMMLKDIRRHTTEYLQRSKLKSLVLGVSGGIDSALVAAIVRPICDSLKIKLIGVSLPSPTNKVDEIERARTTGEEFCDEFGTIDIETYTESFVTFKVDDIKSKIRFGNIKARTRMILLYDTAQDNDGCVLSTDNYTELMLGFWTLHGDVGDLSPIQNIWKTQVYLMSDYIIKNEKLTKKQRDSLQSCIDAVPTDGLGITNSDLDQIGAKTYREVDEILENYLDSYWKGKKLETNHPVIQRHLKTEFKRNNPYNIPVDR